MAKDIYATQREEHEGMAHALALRHNSSGDLRQLTNAVHSRNELNGLRGLNTLIAPDVPVGK